MRHIHHYYTTQCFKLQDLQKDLRRSRGLRKGYSVRYFLASSMSFLEISPVKILSVNRVVISVSLSSCSKPNRCPISCFNTLIWSSDVFNTSLFNWIMVSVCLNSEPFLKVPERLYLSFWSASTSIKRLVVMLSPARRENSKSESLSTPTEPSAISNRVVWLSASRIAIVVSCTSFANVTFTVTPTDARAFFQSSSALVAAGLTASSA